MPDIINAIFEIFAGLFLLLDVRAIQRDKEVRGFSPISATFFAVWTLWSAVYYGLLNQPFSCWVAVICFTINLVWLTTVYHYHKARKP